MVQLVVRCVLAAVLVAAALAKLARPGESRDALLGLLRGPTFTAARGPLTWAPLAGLVLVELVLAAGVAAGLDAFAFAASALLLAGAAALGRALAAGQEGAPCGCFGARSTVSPLAVARSLVLAAAFLAVPFVPDADPSADAWLAAGLALALVAVVVLGVVVLALAREVGMLRLAVGPQSALEVPEEGPPLGADTGLAGHLDPRVDATVLGLAVFTSEGCRMCQQLAPAVAALGRDPFVDLLVFDEVRDAAVWSQLAIPGSPFAIALDAGGHVLAKGTFNSLGQLESVLATAERRRREQAGV